MFRFVILQPTTVGLHDDHNQLYMSVSDTHAHPDTHTATHTEANHTRQPLQTCCLHTVTTICCVNDSHTQRGWLRTHTQTLRHTQTLQLSVEGSWHTRWTYSSSPPFLCDVPSFHPTPFTLISPSHVKSHQLVLTLKRTLIDVYKGFGSISYAQRLLFCYLV